MKRILGLVLVVLLPTVSQAQLVPGQHSITPQFGASFATNDLLHATALHPVDRGAGRIEIVTVVTDIGLDPGVFSGFRYSYNMTRRLAVEAEVGFGVSVFAIQMLELQEEMEGEPQYETTTTDARILKYFLNLSYYLGSWNVTRPYVTVGVGSQNMDLRQKGEVNPDPILDRAYMAGLGVAFRANDLLRIHFEVRNYMYNFHFDNQFVGERSDEIVFRRDIGLATAEASPRFQNDLVVSLGFQISPF